MRQPQTRAPFPHVKPNSTNYCTLEKPKRIEKNDSITKLKTQTNIKKVS